MRNGLPDDVTFHVRPGKKNRARLYILGPTEDGTPDEERVLEVGPSYYHGETTCNPFGIDLGEVWVKLKAGDQWVGQSLEKLLTESYTQLDGSTRAGSPTNLRLFPRIQHELALGEIQVVEITRGEFSTVFLKYRKGSRDGQLSLEELAPSP